MKTWKLIQNKPNEYFYVTVGERSRIFYKAYPYFDGFAVVHPTRDLKSVCFRDSQGEISHPYLYAMSYHNGFARVLFKGDRKWQFRDIAGRISLTKTQSGEDLYKLYWQKVKDIV